MIANILSRTDLHFFDFFSVYAGKSRVRACVGPLSGWCEVRGDKNREKDMISTGIMIKCMKIRNYQHTGSLAAGVSGSIT